MTREQEVATFLRADATLTTLAPGSAYAYGDLGKEKISDPITTPTVWTGGVFNTSLVIRQRVLVPTGDLQSTRSQHTSASQAIEVWGYGLSAAAIEAALQRVYILMMGKKLTRAFRATWAGSGLPIDQAPELPSGVRVGMESYRIMQIRRPVAA